MSLKNFHLLFIAVAVLLALVCAILAFGRVTGDATPASAAALLASVAAAVLLVRYEAGFMRRCRERGIR